MGYSWISNFQHGLVSRTSSFSNKGFSPPLKLTAKVLENSCLESLLSFWSFGLFSGAFAVSFRKGNPMLATPPTNDATFNSAGVTVLKHTASTQCGWWFSTCRKRCKKRCHCVAPSPWIRTGGLCFWQREDLSGKACFFINGGERPGVMGNDWVKMRCLKPYIHVTLYKISSLHVYTTITNDMPK